MQKDASTEVIEENTPGEIDEPLIHSLRNYFDKRLGDKVLIHEDNS